MFRLRTEPGHPRPGTPPEAGQTVVRFGAAHGALAGVASRFGVALRLINDPARHVHLFLDASLQRLPAYSFHPNDNRATVVISREEFLRYLAAVGNTYEFIELY